MIGSWISAAVSAILFLLFQAQGIYTGDSGDLVTAAALGGVPHPPGYPLYTLLGWLLSHISFSTVSWRLTLLSSIPHAITVGLVYAVIYRLTKKNVIASIFGALSLSANYLFFLYSVTPEVFALFDMFVVLLWFLLFTWQESKNIRFLYAAFFIFGLSLSHHHVMLFFVPAILYFLWANRSILLPVMKHPVSVLRGIGLVALGFLPYLYIPFAAAGDPIINWDRVVNPGAFWRLISRADYGTFVSGGSFGQTLGDGFPVFAEGQTGALFLPNIILFKLLPPVTAYNAALAMTVLLLGAGMYWLCRIMKLSPLPSWFVSVSIMFSGLTMSQLTHITLLQGMSMLPSITALSILVVTRNTHPWTGLLAFALSQQIFAGFPQSTFLTLSISAVFVCYHALVVEKKWKSCVIWSAGVVLGIMGGSAQLLPSYEFLRASTDPSGFSPATSTMYSMPVKHLISFLQPFALGNPKTGTYPPFYAFDGSIFWENTAYIGLLPVLLLPLAFVYIRKIRLLPLLLSVMVISLALAGGKYAPSYILFSMWPLTLFRVPSRFLWLSIISMALTGGYIVDYLLQKLKNKRTHILIAVIILLHTAQIMTTWWSYHMLEPAQAWLNKPAITTLIGSDRIITVGHGALYNRFVTKTGWTSPEPYRFLRLGLAPDSNVLWGISQHNVYAGRYLKRPSITDSLLAESIKTNDQTATISAVRFINLFSVRYVLSFLPVDAPSLIPVTSLREGDMNLTLYENPEFIPRARLVFEATTAATLTEAVTTLTGPDFPARTSVLLEAHEVKRTPALAPFISQLRTAPVSPDKSGIIWQQNTNTSIALDVTAPSDALLVLSDTNYPGWIAAIDGNTTPILTANLSQRAIMIPKGNHSVTIRYTPVSIRWGVGLSLVSTILIALLVVVPTLSSAVHIRKKVHGRARHHRGTRHT